MYCPKCSASLEEDPRGWLRCTSGQLEFSVDLSRKLRATYAANTPYPGVADLSGKRLFCPGCRGTVSSASDYSCMSCGTSMKPFLWDLIALHPHGDGTGKHF